MDIRVRNNFLILLAQKEQHERRRIMNKEVSEATGISEHTIGRWVRDEITRFDADVLAALCTYFDCEIGDLLYLEWKPE